MLSNQHVVKPHATFENQSVSLYEPRHKKRPRKRTLNLARRIQSPTLRGTSPPKHRKKSKQGAARWKKQRSLLRMRNIRGIVVPWAGWHISSSSILTPILTQTLYEGFGVSVPSFRMSSTHSSLLSRQAWLTATFSRRLLRVALEHFIIDVFVCRRGPTSLKKLFKAL